MAMSLFAQLQTPYRRAEPVLTGSGDPQAYDYHCVDCPCVFYHDGHWWLLHVGFDGVGYRSAYAFSDDLLHWEKQGVNFAWGPEGAWDAVSAAGFWVLRENALDRPYPKQHDGRYWMVYQAYPGKGYEVGPGRLGLAWSTDLWHWQRAQQQPILVPEDGGEWEQAGLYKPCLLEHEGTFYLFYNAKNKQTGWIEQTGLATSRDLRHWERHPKNPLLRVGPRGSWRQDFLSDPAIYRLGDQWINACFGAHFAPESSRAEGGLAWSPDLINWEIAPEPLLPVGPAGALDSRYAHKSSLVLHQGVLYHFYCAVRPKRDPAEPGVGDEYRTIAVATSQPV